MVAPRRRLPGLHPQLRRRERRRDRRHRGHPQPPRVPARPRGRRAVGQPVVPVADGGRRVRRGGLPRDRPPLRHPRRGAPADRGCSRPGAPRARRHRPQPHLGRASRGSGRRSRASPGSPARARYVFRDGRGAARRRAAEQLAERLRRPGVDPRRVARRPSRRSGTCTSSTRASRTSTGRTTRCGPSSRRSCASGSTSASTASGSTSPTGSRRTPPCPTSRPMPTPGAWTRAIRSGVRTAPTRSTGPGGGSRMSYGGDRVFVGRDRPDGARRRHAPRPLPAAGRAAPGVRLRLPSLDVGRRRAAGRDRPDGRDAGSHRGARDVGALEPRRDPPR